MRSQLIAVFCLALPALAGCRTDPAVTMLEQENRQLEDMIYQQRDIIEDYRRQLDGFGSSGTSSGLPGILDRGASDSAGPIFPGAEKRRDRTPSSDTDPSTPSFTGPPDIDWGDATQAEPGSTISPGAPSRDPEPAEAPAFVPKGSLPKGATGRSSSTGSGAGSARVASIALSDVFSWRYNIEGPGRHQGLSVVVQPQDPAGRSVRAAAPVSIVVLDPAASGQASRVARWDFTASEVADLYRKSSLTDGINLEMLWPSGSPANARLHLFVRYQTDDGRNVQADKLIDIDAAQQGPAWEPQSVPKEVPTENRTATEPRPERSAAVPRVPTPAPPRNSGQSALQSHRPSWSPDRR